MTILDDFDKHVTSTSTADIRKRRRENNIKANAIKNPGKYTVRDDRGIVIAFGTASECIAKLYLEISAQNKNNVPIYVCTMCKKSYKPRHGASKTCSTECGDARRRELRKFENNSHKNKKNLERYHQNSDAYNERRRAVRQAKKEAKANDTV